MVVLVFGLTLVVVIVIVVIIGGARWIFQSVNENRLIATLKEKTAQKDLSAAKAMLAAHDGQRVEAWRLVEEAATAEDGEWADVEYARYIVYRNSGDSDKALYWEERSKHAQDRLMIQGIEEQPLRVYDLQGRLLQTENGTQISVGNLAEGTYLLQIGTQVVRFIKN